MSTKLFESALGITDPWFIESVKFDEAAKTLTVLINFKAGIRTVIFLIAGKLDFHAINPHAGQPT